MPPQLDWQIGDDDGAEEWLPVELPPPPPPPLLRRALRRVPRWVEYALLAMVMIAAWTGYMSVQQRYAAAQERIKFQIQSVIDLEAQAFARRDGELFRAQIDPWAGEWEREQRRRFYSECQSAVQANTPSLDSCYPILDAQVEDVDLRQDIALVQVIEGNPPVRRARFYRKTAQGWLHTAPKPDFWQPTVETRYETLTVYSHPRDVPYAQPMLEHIAGALAQVCERVGCPSGGGLNVELVARRTTGEALPRFEGDRLLVDSPWLLGIPVEQTLNDSYYALLTREIARAAIHSAMGLTDDQSPSLLQQAIADEFISWYETHDTSSVPLLGRIIARNGVKALPDVLRSAAGDPPLDGFVSAWLAANPGDGSAEEASAFFQTLLDIERAALLGGRKETFLLFQAEPNLDIYDSTLAQTPQETLFLDVQRIKGFDTLPDIRVIAVEIQGDTARVRVDVSPAAPLLQPPIEFFYRQNGVWKHSMPYYALDYSYFLSEQPDEQDAVTIRFGCYGWEQPAFEKWAAQFSEQHPDVRVRIVPMDRLLSPISGLDADTIYERSYRIMSHVDVTQYYQSLSAMIESGLVYNLAPLIDSDGGLDAADLLPGLLEQGRWGNGIWSLPFETQALVIQYDKDVFDAAGVAYPQVGWTHDEFLATAQALTERQNCQVLRYGFVDLNMGLFAFIHSRLGQSPTRAEWVDAVRWYTDLALTHGVMPHPQALGLESSRNEYSSALYQLISDKQVAMWSSGANWNYQGESSNLGMAPFPVAQQPVNLIYGSSHVMNAYTAHPQACWQWMIFLGRQYESYSPSSTMRLPVRRSVLESNNYLAQLAPEMADTIRYVLHNGRNMASIGPMQPLYDAIAAVYAGASVEEALGD